jgi:hypothetical protein
MKLNLEWDTRRQQINKNYQIIFLRINNNNNKLSETNNSTDYIEIYEKINQK